MLLREFSDLVVVDPFVGLTHAVADDLVPFAGEVEGHAVGEMAAVGEVHREDGVAVLQGGEVDSHVRLGPRVRLHVGRKFAPRPWRERGWRRGGEQFQQAFDGEPFGDIDELAAAVVALAGIALGVFVE